MPIKSSRENEMTLNSYELGVDAYISGSPSDVSRFKEWLDKTLSHFSKDARIFEVGSGFGRDACYIESKGFKVERSDAKKAFIHVLQQKGFSAQLFNLLADDFTGIYDLIFANAVLLHFTSSEFKTALSKIYSALSTNGIFSFTVKHGDGEEWTSVKVGHPRYFRYWQMDALTPVLESQGFSVLDCSTDEKWLQLITRKT